MRAALRDKGRIRYQEISARLKLVHPEFEHTVYFATRDAPPRIAITVGGRAQLFAAVDEFVARAPEMEGLRIIALKAPWPGNMRSLERASMGSHLNSKWGDLWYSREPREGGAYAYTVYVPDKLPADREGFRKSVAFLLGLCFGERLGATVIHSVEVRQLNGAPPYTGLRPFTEAQADAIAKQD